MGNAYMRHLTIRSSVIGIDVGASKIAAGIVSVRGKLLYRREQLTPRRGVRTLLDALTGIIGELRVHNRSTAVGIGMPGHVDPVRGIVYRLPNIRGWGKTAVGPFLTRKTMLPVFLDNDAKCFALAEYTYGAGRQYRPGVMVGITLGTGIGSGIVAGGRIFRGRNNLAGEVEHYLIPTVGGPPVRIEQRGAGSALERRYAARTGRKLEARAIEARQAAGDRLAREVLEEVAELIGVDIANVIHTVNPDLIVVGGGFARHRGLLSLVRASVRRYVLYPALRNTPIIHARLGEDAGIVGAALIAKSA